MSTEVAYPTYDELPSIEALRARHGWGVFGPDDELGRLNLMTPEVVSSAAAGVSRGAVFNLCLPLNLPDPPWGGERHQYRHTVFDLNRNSQDDFLDEFYLQKSTQWDGFRHVRAREFGFWGGVVEGAGAGGSRLGIEKWAEHGVVGRGVLADVERHLAAQGRPIGPEEGTAITVEDLEATLAAQEVVLRGGDVLMVRTGYLDAYLQGSGADRERFSKGKEFPGLHAGEEMARYLWDRGVAAVVTDNPAVEVAPGDPSIGSLHRRLIPLLGFALGELFDLGRLALDCAADRRYTCLFVAAPLNLPGGVGSPGNAVAVK
jgi:kynurenine formamidase